MFIYFIKSTSCLALFFLFYKLFLEKENMHVFKRLYLIGILVLSFSIPLITFTTEIEAIERATEIPDFNATGQDMGGVLFAEIILVIYGIGVLIFAARFLKNLSFLIFRIQNNTRVKNKFFTNILLQETVTPHTFLKYIFLNKSDFESNNIPDCVLLHEQSHAIQMHSIDIIFVELIQIFFWFNPLIYWVRDSIQLNHEFLADQAVLRSGFQPNQYQNILLQFATQERAPMFSNSINYSIIKKRFIVMKSKNTNQNIWFKGLIVLPLIALLVFAFSNSEEVEISQADSTNMASQEGASKEQIAEYNKIVKNYNAMHSSPMIVKKSDVDRLTYLYSLMSENQIRKVAPFPNFPPPPPTVEKEEEPMVVTIGVNDKDPKAPPPPPKPITVGEKTPPTPPSN